MKKTFLLLIISVLFLQTSIAQPQCADDIWYDLKQNAVLKAKRTLDACMPDNQNSAELWLIKGNVELQLFQFEGNRKKRDANYELRYPNAIIESANAFYKSVELKAEVKPMSGMLDPKYGQSLVAPAIGEMAALEMQAKQYDKAIEYLQIAIRSYRADATANRKYIAYCFYDMAICYNVKGDKENYIKSLEEAAKLKVDFAEIYLNLYDEYKALNDTVNCGKILATGRGAVPDSAALDLKGYELDYYAFCGETEKFEQAADTLFKMYSTEPAVINIIAIHLLNKGYLEKAEPMILAGLAIDSNNFALNQQMAYRYYYELEKFQEESTAARAEQNWDKVREIQAKEKEVLAVAHKWLEKAYSINADDRNNNIMLNQVKLRLLMPVPPELKEKVDSYYKKAE